MMVMVDNNFLIKLVSNQQSYKVFYQSLKRREISIGLPTPVIGEFLVIDENSKRISFLNKVNSYSQIYDYDMKSAVIGAKIFSDLKRKEYFKGNNGARQVIKVDIQIIAITMSNRVKNLYTEDKGLINIIKELDLPIEVIDFEKDELQGLSLFETISKASNF